MQLLDKERIKYLLFVIGALTMIICEAQLVILLERDIINNMSEVDEDKIIFKEGEQEYVYGLQELGLIKYIEYYDYGLGGVDKTFCKDREQLKNQLFMLSQKVNRQPKDASYYLDEERNLSIRNEEKGRELQIEKLIGILGDRTIYERYYQVPYKELLPEVFREELLERKPDTIWAQYTTIVADIPDRTENVRLASLKLDGTIVAPGTECSFNETVGRRDAENGYRPAKIIIAGRMEYGIGGGVCQVSSTLYNALLLAGLKIKERHPHSITIAYVPPGKDATVVYDSKDLRFINDSDSYLLIRAKLEDLKLTLSIYGKERELTPINEVHLSNYINDKARLISRIDTTPSYCVEEGVLWKPKIKIWREVFSLQGMTMKKLVSTVLITVCVMTFTVGTAWAKGKPDFAAAKTKNTRMLEEKIRVRGMNLKFDVPPVIKEGRTLIPVRAIMNGLGANVDWNPETKEVTVTRDGKEIVLNLVSGEITVNGEEVEIDVPAQIINNRTFVPLRFIAQTLGEKVDYNEETGDIEIGDDEATTEEDIEENTENNTEDSNPEDES